MLYVCQRHYSIRLTVLKNKQYRGIIYMNNYYNFGQHIFSFAENIVVYCLPNRLLYGLAFLFIDYSSDFNFHQSGNKLYRTVNYHASP